MERFGGAAKIEKPKLVPVSEDLDTYSGLLQEEMARANERISRLGERAERVVKPLSRQERIHLAQYPTDADSAFAKGHIMPLTRDAIDGERDRIKSLEEHVVELKRMNEDISEGQVPGYEGIRAVKEALHVDQMGLSDAEDRLGVLHRKHNAGEQLAPVDYRDMRELSAEIALRRERIKRMTGRISMFGEVLHAQEQEHGGGAEGMRRAGVERRSSRLLKKAENQHGQGELEGEEDSSDEILFHSDEEIAA